MKPEKLETIWNRQKEEINAHCSRSDVLDLIDEKMTSFDRTIRGRDRREIAACVFVMLCFGFLIFWVSSVWSQLGCAVIVLGAGLIWYRLKKARTETSRVANHSLKKHLKLELQKVTAQKNLLVTIAWWYILPIFIGLLLFIIGSPWYPFMKICYMIAVSGLSVGIWWWNQRAVKQKFDPLIEELRLSIAFTESE